MPHHAGIGITQCLQRADRCSLLAHQPHHQHVQQQGGDQQECRRQEIRRHPQATQFIGEKPVRQPARAGDRVDHTIVTAAFFDAVQHFAWALSRSEASDELIASCAEVERLLEQRAASKEDSELLRIRNQTSRRQQIHELRTLHRADHGHVTKLLVEQQLQTIAGPNAVVAGEGIVDQDFAPTIGRETPSATQQHAVDGHMSARCLAASLRPPSGSDGPVRGEHGPWVDRHDLPADPAMSAVVPRRPLSRCVVDRGHRRRSKVVGRTERSRNRGHRACAADRNSRGDVEDDASLEFTDAHGTPNALQIAARHPLQRDPEIGQATLSVVIVARTGEVSVQRHHGAEAVRPQHDDQEDRKDQAAMPP